MYIIQNGSVEIYKNTDGSTVSLAVLKPHEFFGEMAFFDNTRSASAKALEDSEILVINKEIFSSFIKEPIVWQVLEKMGQRIKETDDRLINYWSCKVQQHD
jgi:CRP-like cAMP-binding protein